LQAYILSNHHRLIKRQLKNNDRNFQHFSFSWNQ
jgi:hypothetical protein